MAARRAAGSSGIRALRDLDRTGFDESLHGLLIDVVRRDFPTLPRPAMRRPTAASATFNGLRVFLVTVVAIPPR
jgi:hypothetical protein